MKKTYLAILFCISLLLSCTQQKTKKLSDNPLLNEFDTPFGVPPFEKIKSKHFLPAFKEGMKQQNEEIKAIIDNNDAPDFENTIEAYEYSGSLLSKVAMVFYNIHSSNTNDTIQKLAQEISPMLTQHDDSINMNPKLFKRVKEVYEQKNKLSLNAEQKQLLEVIYRSFVRSGALLNETQQKRMKEINKELSELTLKFGDNVLAETNNFKLIIDKKKDLAGLPQGLIDASAQTAKEAKMEGKWLFTIRTSSITPFLENSEKRSLREKIYKAYINKGNNNDKYDNKEIIEKIVTLRLERANMLGDKTHADYVLDENMAKNPATVNNLL
ncbi:MAG: M3 family metallopeptidase, partial [Bacteroidales bacterium]|nr:M3 family metallopeptidase [Bacteroidales bacterium]